MLNEIEEFYAYTGVVNYCANGKYDSTYLGRFTYDMLLEFEGLTRVLTIIARGYMFQNDTEPQIDYARRALCTWCSIPDSKKASPKEDWQYKTDFSEHHVELPELVDADGSGWFCRHVHNVISFVQNNPNKVMKTAQDNCKDRQKGFDREWRKKVLQFQVPLFASTTIGAWVLRFDDILADALELGPLQNKEIIFTPEELQQFKAATPKGVPDNVIPTLIAYYRANKPEDSDWAVLPVSNFDAYFGTTSFSKKWLKLIPSELMERSGSGYGICRYRVVASDFLPAF
jgi:hypothetical protein